MFVKYNGVLRGLRSDSPFLKNSMITLCCPREVANAYMGGARLFEPAAGSIALDEAMRSLNKYATTLHGINSSIIKLGKLTKAQPVYRGLSWRILPDQFWSPNEQARACTRARAARESTESTGRHARELRPRRSSLLLFFFPVFPAASSTSP